MVNEAIEALRRLGKGGRGVEDSVSYSLGHRIRIEIRAALHEGPANCTQLAKMTHQPLSTISHHVKEMLNDGSIEVARTEKVGNVDQHYYRVVQLPHFSEEDVAAMSEADRRALYAMIIQAATAEAMASLWSGKMIRDRLAWLAWNRVNLDRQGREDMADEEARSWRRKHEIEAESANRRSESGEPGTTYVIATFSYERSRTSAPDPLAPGGG
jgi:DNA-binding transcriptional ArsR family regulator